MTSMTLSIDQLRLSPLNVRTNEADASATTALEASILAEGVLQSLSVHPMRGNTKLYGVFAGGRRYRSIRRLVDRGDLPRDFSVPVIVNEAADVEIVARSLSENMLRRDLRSYETFAAIVRERNLGHTAEQIAARHGQELTWVNRALRLGDLAKPVFEAFAAGRLSDEQVKAYGATGDHEAQRAAFEALSAGPEHARTPAAIRAWLRVDDREAGRLLRFVGREAYLDAGGAIERDLFAEGEDESGIVTNDKLLRQLADEKIASLREDTRARFGRPDMRFLTRKPEGTYGGPDWILHVNTPAEGEPLPEGDVVACVEIPENGEAEVSFWWPDRKTMLAATRKDSADKEPRSAPSSRSAGRLKAGSAIGQQYDGARQQADALIKEEAGLTAEGVQVMRSIRRAILRGAIVQNAREGRTLGRDYLVWAQLRMMLPTGTYPDRPDQVGMRAIASGEADPDPARAQINEIEAGKVWQAAVRELQAEPFLTDSDLAAAFQSFLDAPQKARDLAAAVVAGIALERSLEADAYIVRVHDVLAVQARVAHVQGLRHWWQPSAAFLDLLPTGERRAIAEPFVDEKTYAAWAKYKSAELTPLVLRVVEGSAPVIRTMNLKIAAAQWVHPLLHFRTDAGVRIAAELEAAE